MASMGDVDNGESQFEGRNGLRREGGNKGVVIIGSDKESGSENNKYLNKNVET